MIGTAFAYAYVGTLALGAGVLSVVLIVTAGLEWHTNRRRA
jgi:hypothetical protein